MASEGFGIRDKVRIMFRVVGYLPGTHSQAMIAHDLRAGVAQASMEETAENTTAGVQGQNAMGIRVAV
ncbi:hypothetical protein [Simplicispira suum]|nr:hypothetical protein [Simplicispira suum]